MDSSIVHRYQLGESTFIFGDIGCDLIFLFTFSMNFLQANRIAPDGTPRFAASHLGLFCLPCPTKRTLGLNELRSSFAGVHVSTLFSNIK